LLIIGFAMSDLQLRIAHISDTHITRFGMHLPDMLDRCVSLIAKLEPKPDVIVHSGDITDNGVLDDYELASEKLGAIPYELLIAPGNHDERNNGDSLFKEIIGPVDFEASIGKAVFLLLDSAVPDSDNGRLGRHRQGLITSKFRALPDGVLKILVLHHHIIPVPFAGREKDILEDAGDVLKVILDAGVDLVLMGHRHVRNAMQVNGTIFVNAGTVASVRTRGRLGNSFNVIDISKDDTISVKVINIRSGEEETGWFFKLRRKENK